MIDKLKEIVKNSYAPYSNYHVGCVLVTKDGKEFTGINVEIASYGGTICAERNAINNAITNGYKKNDFLEIHIINDTNKKGMPCMLCRQSFIEFFDNDVKVYCYDIEGNYEVYSVVDLCPHPFSEEDLK